MCHSRFVSSRFRLLLRFPSDVRETCPHFTVASMGGGGPPRVTPYREVTPERKKCEQIYKVLWTSEVGEVKKGRGDTLQGGGVTHE